MRYFKIFMIGFLVILIIQFGVLVFLENVYFANNSVYSSTKVEDNLTKELSNSKLTLKDGSTNISASYNGKYVSSLNNGDLFISNSEHTNEIKVPASKGMEISYYKWVYDRNRLILAERSVNTQNRKFFKLYYYDIDNKNKVEISNETSNKSVKIPINKSDEKIKAIDMSTLTNTIYVKLSDSNNYSRVYSINIMLEKKSVDTVSHNIGKIISSKRDNVMIYENLDNGKAYSNRNNLPIKIQGKNNLSLLGIDNNDNIYLALTDNDKTKLIYYGNVYKQIWEKVNISESVNINNIHVNFNGKVFIEDTSKSIIKEVLTGKEINYTGKIVDINDNVIISKKNNEIFRTILQ